jgi:hypothetical protein
MKKLHRDYNAEVTGRIEYVGFEVLRAVVIRSTIFWDITLVVH